MRQLAALALLGLVQAVAAEPVRIVTLAPHLAEMVYAAGAGDRLVGSVAYTDYPDQAKALPRVGDAFGVDAERLVALSPDLVLAWQGGNAAAVISRVRGLGIRVVALPATGVEDVPGQLETIGALAGTPDAAAQAARSYRAKIDRLRAAHGSAPSLRVFYQVSARPLYTVGGDQPISALIELCGGSNVFADDNRGAFVVSREAVIARDPELILAGGDTSPPDLAQWADWQGLTAAEAGNLMSVNADHVARPGPRLALGAAEVCAAMDTARQSLKRESSPD